MKRKNVLLLILVAIVLIGFTILSIVKENLTTVEGIIAKVTKTASTEVVEEEKQNEGDGYTVLSSEPAPQAEPEPTVQPEEVLEAEPQSQPETDNSTVADDIVTNNELVNNTVQEVALDVPVNNTTQEQSVPIASLSASKAEDKVGSINNVTNVTNPLNEANTANTINKTNTTNTLVNKDKLPAAGAKTFIIWTLIVLAIISVISNIKYNNIILK